MRVITSSFVWMNNDLTTQCTKKVLGTFSFGRRFLMWDSFECHMDSKVAALLLSSQIYQEKRRMMEDARRMHKVYSSA